MQERIVYRWMDQQAHPDETVASNVKNTIGRQNRTEVVGVKPGKTMFSRQAMYRTRTLEQLDQDEQAARAAILQRNVQFDGSPDNINEAQDADNEAEDDLEDESRADELEKEEELVLDRPEEDDPVAMDEPNEDLVDKAGERKWKLFSSSRHNPNKLDLSRDGHLPILVRTELTLATDKFHNPKYPAKFRRVIADECQAVRYIGNTFHQFIASMPKERIQLVSATPTLNSVKDMKGLARLISLTSDLPKMTVEASHTGDLTQSDGSFEPFSEEGLRVLGLTELDMKEAKDPNDPNSEKAKLNNLKAWYDYEKETKQPPFWMLDPGLYARCGSTSTPENESLSATIYTALVAMLVIRRTMKTPLKMPDGTTTFPAVDIPAPDIAMVEVSHGPSIQRSSIEVMDRWIRLLGAPPEAPGIAVNVDKVMSAKDGVKETQDVSMNMGVHRFLSMASFDYMIQRLFFDVTIADRDPLMRVSLTSLAEDYRGKVGSQVTEAYRHVLARAAKREEGRVDPKFGVDHVNEVLAIDKDGGLTWKYSCMHGPEYIPPIDRASMVIWAISQSPIMVEAIRIIVHNIRRGLKTVVMIENPLCLS